MSNWKDSAATTVGATGIAVLIILLFIMTPAWFVWSANLLMAASGIPYHIPFTFWTWFASFVFLGCVRGSTSSKR